MRALVTFSAAGTRYGIDVSAVARVLEREPIRPLPDPLPGVSGLVSLNGRTLPVLGLLAPAGVHLLILRSDGLDFGLLVDEVTGVLRVRESDLQAAPAGQAAPSVLGTVADTLVLDPAVLARHLRPAPGRTGEPEPASRPGGPPVSGPPGGGPLPAPAPLNPDTLAADD